MPTQIQLRRGTTAQTSTFIGAVAEITVDTSKNVVVVHDGSNAGGHPLASEILALSAYQQANAAFEAANNVAPQVAPAFNQANSAFIHANAAFDLANTVQSVNNTQNTNINIATNTAQLAFNKANTAASDVQTANTWLQANDYITLTTARSYTDTANTYLDTKKFDKSGGSITGPVTITANLSVSGNLFVTGNVTTTDVNNVVLSNSIIYLAHDNPANTTDIGLVGSFTEGYYQHTGVVRDNADGVWKFFSNVVNEPAGTVDFTDAIWDTIKVGGIESPTANINGVELGSYTQSSYAHANAAFNTANTLTQQTTFVGVDTVTVDIFNSSQYRGGSYEILASSQVGYQLIKLMVVHNTYNGFVQTYDVSSSGSNVITFSASVVSGNVYVNAAPTVSNTDIVLTNRILFTNLGDKALLPPDLNLGSGTVDLNTGSGVDDLNLP